MGQGTRDIHTRASGGRLEKMQGDLSATYPTFVAGADVGSKDASRAAGGDVSRCCEASSVAVLVGLVKRRQRMGRCQAAGLAQT